MSRYEQSGVRTEDSMRDEQTAGEIAEQQREIEATDEGAAESAPTDLGALDELDNVDFLLEEIENKIAPLALA